MKWVITVKNNCPDKANEIEIIDVLPKGLEFVSYSATKGYYSDGYWKFCCLEVGEIQSLELTTRVKAIGEIKNIATITAKTFFRFSLGSFSYLLPLTLLMLFPPFAKFI